MVNIYLVLQNLTEIADEGVPMTASSHCAVHWAVLGIVAVYGVYAIVRALINRRAMSDDRLDG